LPFNLLSLVVAVAVVVVMSALPASATERDGGWENDAVGLEGGREGGREGGVGG